MRSTIVDHSKGLSVSDGRRFEQIGEVDLIGGWAEVFLDEELPDINEGPGYEVFVTCYGPAQTFVQNRTRRGFEIHVLPGTESRRQVSMRCGYWIVGRKGGTDE